MRAVIVLLFILSLPCAASALVSEGRPGIPYYNHPLFFDKKDVVDGQVTQVRLTYGDPRENSPDCRNSLDVFLGLELFATIPEKSWVLVDYHLQSILVDSGFFGDADIFNVRVCGDLKQCLALRERLENDPAELAKRQFQKPKNIKVAQADDMEQDLEAGRRLVKAARCRGCHDIEGFGASHAPALTWKRYKYVEGWLESYLRKPYRLRPAMNDLMMLNYTSANAQPSLQPIEISAISEYLERVAKAKSPNDRFRNESWQYYDCFNCHTKHYRDRTLQFVPTHVPPTLSTLLDGNGTLQVCVSCHAFGDYRQVKPEGRDNPNRLAPDLLLAMEKLDIDYLVNYVNRPEYMQPGSVMPALPLNDQQQEELRALVHTLRKMIAAGEVAPEYNYYRLEKREP